ncbi:sporulation protein [Stackebrandtia soli]|uniref:sporulation protein n=1 Tax=Stackebrandtia soli TaxID=1892856 RepID=UPI0039EB5EBC
MVFKKMLRRLGVGGPTVDTVLRSADTQPGRTLTGQIELTGGDHDAVIEYIALSLVTQGEVGDGQPSVFEFARTIVSGEFTLAEGEQRALPFEFVVPWETPITTFYGEPLRGMAIGVRTELAVAKAVDKGDLDIVRVHPLASHERVLEAMANLGFRFKSADVELGQIRGTRQQLPFYQEIEYYGPPGRITEAEVTFVTTEFGFELVLEADRRGGAFSGGGDAIGRFDMSHVDADGHDWEGAIGQWLDRVAQYSHHGHHHDGHHDHGHHGGGGMGGVIAGAAAGVVGGMVLGEVLDEVGDSFFGEEEE